MSSAEAREVQDPAFMRRFNQNAAICLNDDNGETVDTENGNDELIADGSGPGDFDDNDNTKQKDDVGDSGENVNDDDDDDDENNVDLVDNDHDADDNDENGFSDINDNDVSIETLEDDVDSFHHIGFLENASGWVAACPTIGDTTTIFINIVITNTTALASTGFSSLTCTRSLALNLLQVSLTQYR